LGSAVWQQSLALAGLAIRSVTTPKVRTWLSLLGGTMIIGLSIILAYRTITAS
jgi:arginine exporter protein ArgO